MKITNLSKNEAYDLNPDAKLEVERPNPFFNEYAELTLPLSMPASPRNCRLLGFPDLFGGRVKMISSMVDIQDGEYHAHCRQTILSATRKGTIQSSFYINDGSFYARLQDVKLKEVFSQAQDIISFNSTAEVIQFCSRLRDNRDPRFSIFPVLVTDDSGSDTGFNYKIINAFGHDVRLTQSETMFIPDSVGTGNNFYNASRRTEIVDDLTISLDPGYYMSPFIRATYVLERIFSYLGYTLESNFFTRTEPFRSMVLLNNVIDTVINMKLHVSDLVPDVGISDMLAVFRKKFCCEFSIDETHRSASIIFLKDMVAAVPSADLTDRVTEEPTISYKAEKDFSRIVLKAKSSLENETDDTYDSLAELSKNCPNAYFDETTGCFCRQGFSGCYEVKVKVGESSQAYDTGEALEAKEVKIPEIVPEFRTLRYTYTDEDDNVRECILGDFLFVGNYRTVNSVMVVSGGEAQETDDAGEKMMPMLAFTSDYGGRASGSVTSWTWGPVRDISGIIFLRTPCHIWNYSLVYNGPEGIFEKFYRPYDLLARNSLQEVKVKLLLSQREKQDLLPYTKVVIRGVEFFLNKLKFTVGGKKEPVESHLLTSGLYHDQDTGAISEPPSMVSMFPFMDTEYQWVGRMTEDQLSESEFNAAAGMSPQDVERAFQTLFPPIPGPEWEGREWGRQTALLKYESRLSLHQIFRIYEYTRVTVWLECVHK